MNDRNVKCSFLSVLHTDEVVQYKFQMLNFGRQI